MHKLILAYEGTYFIFPSYFALLEVLIEKFTQFIEFLVLKIVLESATVNLLMINAVSLH